LVGTQSQRRKKMLLEDKNGVIYGGGGSIGGAVGRAFAREGARVMFSQSDQYGGHPAGVAGSGTSKLPCSETLHSSTGRLFAFTEFSEV
jgi:hypothetical protein